MRTLTIVSLFLLAACGGSEPAPTPAPEPAKKEEPAPAPAKAKQKAKGKAKADAGAAFAKMSDDEKKAYLMERGEKVYKTMIPRNVRVSEAPSVGKPVLLYDLQCTGSQAYISLAKEIVQQERKRRREEQGEAA